MAAFAHHFGLGISVSASCHVHEATKQRMKTKAEVEGEANRPSAAKCPTDERRRRGQAQRRAGT